MTPLYGVRWPSLVNLKRPFTSPTRTVNAHDMDTFKDNPFQLVGKSSILRDEDEKVFYEVVEMGLSKKAMWYQI
jgi:hypothetical protein